jgi:hypothetical protein
MFNMFSLIPQEHLWLFSIRNISRLIMFKKTIGVCCCRRSPKIHSVGAMPNYWKLSQGWTQLSVAPVAYDDELVHETPHFEIIQLRSSFCSNLCDCIIIPLLATFFVADCLGFRLLAIAFCESHNSCSTEQKSWTIFSYVEQGQQVAHTNMHTLCQSTPTYFEGRPFPLLI